MQYPGSFGLARQARHLAPQLLRQPLNRPLTVAAAEGGVKEGGGKGKGKGRKPKADEGGSKGSGGHVFEASTRLHHFMIFCEDVQLSPKKCIHARTHAHTSTCTHASSNAHASM
jgi:hypothetical protein